jgi:hypothetical protein
MTEQRHSFGCANEERMPSCPWFDAIIHQKPMRMGATWTRSIILLLLLCFSRQLSAQIDQPGWRLSGIINLPDLKQAVLQKQPASPIEKETVILAEGETGGRADQIELVKIDYKNETADVSTNKVLATLALNFQSQNNHAETEPTILFERANFDAVLDLYSTLLGRTLLRHPLLRETDFTFSAQAGNRGEAVHAIENALADKGITCIPDGDIFAMLVPKEIAPRIKAENFKNNIPESESPHNIQYDFQNVPIMQAADVYTGLFGCTLKMDEPFPAPGSAMLKLRTVTKLSKDEAAYALDTLFKWAGVRIVPAGQHLMKAVPVAGKE